MVPTPLNESQQSIDRGYEVGDVSAKTVGIFVPSLIVFTAAVLIGVAVYMSLRERAAINSDQPRSAVADTPLPFNGPVLQPTQGHDTLPQEDLAAMYDRENRVFDSLGWKTEGTGLLPKIPDGLIDQVNARRSDKTTKSPTQDGGKP